MQQRLILARACLEAHQYGEAIDHFEAYLEKHPDDLKALLQLGICHLLNRSERLFLRTYEQARQLKERMAAVPADVLRTFAHYESLVRKVTATALVLGTVAASAAGCASSHKYSGGVDWDADIGDLPTDTQSSVQDAGATDSQPGGTEATPSDTEGDTATSAHRYSGGVALDTEST